MKVPIEMLADAALEMDPLPELSGILLKEVLREPPASTEELLKYVRLDPAMSVNLLHLANSRSFGRPNHVCSIKQVTDVISDDMLIDCLLSQVSRISLSSKPSVIVLNDHCMFWKHSLACARFCEDLAKATGFFDPDVAYLAGLIHDFGKITLYQRYPDQYRAIFEMMEQKEEHLFESEAQIFDNNHSAISGKILQLWNVPALLRQGIASHHYPFGYITGDKPEMQLARLIKTADILAYKIQEGDGGNSSRARGQDLYEEIKPVLANLDVQTVKKIKTGLEQTYRHIGVGNLDGQAYVRSLADANRSLGRRAVQLRMRLREISLLHRLHQVFDVLHELEEILAAVAREIIASHHVASVGFQISAGKNLQTYVAAAQPLPDSAIHNIRRELLRRTQSDMPELTDPLKIPVQTLPVDLPLSPADLEHPPRIVSSSLFELDGHGGPIGTLGVFSDQPQVFTEEERDHFLVVVEMIAMAIDRFYLNQKTEMMSITDGMTGLYNYRQFQVFLKKALVSSKRYGEPMCLIMVDLDHFKRVNDEYGHLVGDQVLQELAGQLRSGTRGSDFIARYGGEEFVILLPRTPLNEGQIIAERIRTNVEKHSFNSVTGPELHVTASFGVTSFPIRGIDDPQELVDASDRALFEAKSAGRNRVCIARECNPERQTSEV